jgi:hypothetical protein
MKKIIEGFLFIAISFASLTSMVAQGPNEYWVGLEEYAVHTEGALAGLTTYRIYLTVPSSADQVTSCTGNDEFPLAFNTTTSFYQNVFGGITQ